MAVNTIQQVFRVRTDATAAQGGTPVWGAAQNTNVVITPGHAFRIRFAVANTGTTDVSAGDILLWYSKNGGAYVSLPGSGSDISYADATGGTSADNSAISTSLLTGASGTFSGTGKYFRGGGSILAFNVPHADYAEYEFGLKFTSPACDGNTYTFRIVSSVSGTPLNSYTVTPSFNMPNNAALAATEANDTIAAAGDVPRAALLDALEVSDVLTGTGTVLWPTGILAITEANDVLTGTAVATPILGVLSITEANDIITASCFALPAGGNAARLGATEASDVLTGAGTGSGDVGSLNTREADDALVGAAGPIVGAVLNATEDNDTVASATLLYANQWAVECGCTNATWTQIIYPAAPIVFPPCGEPPISPVTPLPPETEDDMLAMEQLQVIDATHLGGFTHLPNMALCQLTVDGRPFFPVGATPDFSVNVTGTGASVTWLNTTYSVAPGSTVIASYSWTP